MQNDCTIELQISPQGASVNSVFFLGDQKILTCFIQCYPKRTSISNQQPIYTDIRTLNVFCQHTWGWYGIPWLPTNNVGLHHMASRKSVNITAIQTRLSECLLNEKRTFIEFSQYSEFRKSEKWIGINWKGPVSYLIIYEKLQYELCFVGWSLGYRKSTGSMPYR